MSSHVRIPSWIISHWRTPVVVGCAVGLVAACKWCLETDEIRAQRAGKKREKEVRTLVGRISKYAHSLRRLYPTGEAVVSEVDLALQLHKPPELVVTALGYSARRTTSSKGSFERILETACLGYPVGLTSIFRTPPWPASGSGYQGRRLSRE
jgi:hypothetical protein